MTEGDRHNSLLFSESANNMVSYCHNYIIEAQGNYMNLTNFNTNFLNPDCTRNSYNLECDSPTTADKGKAELMRAEETIRREQQMRWRVSLYSLCVWNCVCSDWYCAGGAAEVQ